ncbi:MAG: hypothetical protein DCE90_17940 [Pseudanabaena sp.]|nr:MAG: hypothetical protein DCE90_17940 [Pseudanabaena sp.]
MSEPPIFEPTAKAEPLDYADLIKVTIDQRTEIKFLEEKIKTLEAQHAKALQQTKAKDINVFNCFKADVIVCLKAIELAAIASQRHGKIALNHHERDMRLKHLQGIVQNAIEDISDRRLVHYEDDF